MTTQVSSAPIGIFDSGVGGISIANTVQSLLPNEQIIYVADNANTPYGEKSPTFVNERCKFITEFLLTHGCKLIVIACNTATVNGVQNLRQLFSVPFAGVEPGIKPAIKASKNGKIGVLATQSTIESSSFNSLLSRFNATSEIYLTACNGLADEIERGINQNTQLNKLVDYYLHPLIEKGIDTLVLGCTHYPLITSLIRRKLPNYVRIIDTSEAVSRQVNSLLVQHNIRRKETTCEHKVFTSCFDQRQVEIISSLWRGSTRIEAL